MHRGSGAVIAETELKLSEATKGLTKLDIREQELKDMEVARKLQDEEIKVGKEARQVICLFILTEITVTSFMYMLKRIH